MKYPPMNWGAPILSPADLGALFEQQAQEASHTRAFAVAMVVADAVALTTLWAKLGWLMAVLLILSGFVASWAFVRSNRAVRKLRRSAALMREVDARLQEIPGASGES